jgi:hypothetical protein
MDAVTEGKRFLSWIRLGDHLGNGCRLTARGRQLIQQSPGGSGDLVDGLLESNFIGLRRLVESADLADKLERGGTDLFLGGGAFRNAKTFDASAHILTV